MQLSLAYLFSFSNGGRKYWNLWPCLAFNIMLENPLVKSRLPCIEVLLATQYQQQTNAIALLIFLRNSHLQIFHRLHLMVTVMYDDKKAKPTIYKVLLASFTMVKNLTKQNRFLVLAFYLCWLFDFWKIRNDWKLYQF